MMTTRSILSRHCFFVGVFAALTLGSTTSLQAADAPAKPTELKVLEKLVGDWTTTGAVTVLDGQPTDLKTTGKVTRKWVLDGRLVEELGKSSDGNEAKVIFGFDIGKRVYRSWYFDSFGTSVDTSGQWDEGAQSFMFRADLGNGIIQTATIHFTGADAQEWSSKVTDSAGKVWFDGSGTLKRQK